MKKFILGFVVGITLLFSFGFIFVLWGGMPVATKAPPLPFEKYIARKAVHAAFKQELGKKAPFDASEAHLVSGAKIYRTQCMVCHGNSRAPATAISKGMFPPPPQLFRPNRGVTDDPVGETYWKVKNGIRLTGMPGYGDNLSEEEMWEVTLFLSDADSLPENAIKILNQ